MKYFITGIETINSEKVRLTINCVMCSNNKYVVANTADVRSWEEGMVIQNAMPELSASDRELLISGTCNDCWNNLFGGHDG